MCCLIFPRARRRQDVFGDGKAFGPDVEERTREAFALTVKKLEKLNQPSAGHKEELARERIDQVTQARMTYVVRGIRTIFRSFLSRMLTSYIITQIKNLKHAIINSSSIFRTS